MKRNMNPTSRMFPLSPTEHGDAFTSAPRARQAAGHGPQGPLGPHAARGGTTCHFSRTRPLGTSPCDGEAQIPDPSWRTLQKPLVARPPARAVEDRLPVRAEHGRLAMGTSCDRWRAPCSMPSAMRGPTYGRRDRGRPALA
jgi:hypothetical protein